ncbi:DUF2235 domain-containing protein [Bradyrhizobium erythrophlei]|uniref:DUF2235 domain-containing protein n=1 Tax=Bradyrhizobium erythrophlei TaxID=1437360 RepID=UPI0035ECD898
MSKKIILLSDGTGNAAGKVWRTNVWRTFQALDLKTSDQIAIYDDGVGTSSFKPLAILGGAFGYGLKRNVINLYKFLCRNYRDGDKIYGFGFSRGAFTIRIVIGLVLNQGLVKFANEAELDRNARAAYRAYRHNKYPVWNLQYPLRLVLSWLDKRFYKSCERKIESIEFVGVWDTVAAYGLPIDEMTRGVNDWLWPLELPNKQFNPMIRKARHALAIDDERATFHPVLWDEDATNTQPSGSSRSSGNEQLLQVWFAGVHSNVGGGYPDDSLANISLAWMMSEAKEAGLVFKDMPDAEPDALISTDSAKDKDGRLYDSRSGLGGYYRYSPRKIQDFYDAMPTTLAVDGAPHAKPVPKIHEAVFGRIKLGAHFYAPIGFPKKYEIVRSSDPYVNYWPSGPMVSNTSATIGPNDPAISEGTPSLDRHKAQEDIWDIVWRRRAIYFLTVFVTGYLLLYPLFRDSYPFQELRTQFRFLSDTIRLVGNVLPGMASRWIDAYARDPAWFVVWAALVAFLIWISSKLKGSINDGMRILWTRYLPGSNAPEQPERPYAASPFQTVLFASAIIYLLVYPELDRPWLRWLALPGDLNDAMLTYTADPVRYVLLAFLVFYFLPARIVRVLRQSRAYQAILRFLKFKVAPALSAAGILYLVVAFGSHYQFNIRDGLGSFCTETPGLAESKSKGFSNVGGKQQAELIFDTSPEATNKPNNICISTGVFVKTGKDYRIVVQRLPDPETKPPSGKWTFFGEESYMGGQPIGRLPFFKAATMALLYPFRHTFDRPWGSIIFRIGSRGNEEDFLDRAPPNQSDDVRVNDAEYAVPDDSERLAEILTPKRDGELFVYLNKPMLGWWGSESRLADWISNTGKARITAESR